MLGLAATRSSKQLHLLGCAHSSRLPFTPLTGGHPEANLEVLKPPPGNFICASDLDCFHMLMHIINIKSYLLQRRHIFIHLYPYT